MLELKVSDSGHEIVVTDSLATASTKDPIAEAFKILSYKKRYDLNRPLILLGIGSGYILKAYKEAGYNVGFIEADQDYLNLALQLHPDLLSYPHFLLSDESALRQALEWCIQNHAQIVAFNQNLIYGQEIKRNFLKRFKARDIQSFSSTQNILNPKSQIKEPDSLIQHQLTALDIKELFLKNLNTNERMRWSLLAELIHKKS